MKSLRCALGFHTGLIGSKYKYLCHRDSKEYDSIIATFEKKCRRCNKKLKNQNFAFMYSDERYLNFLGSKRENIEKAKNFTDNRIG